METQLSTKKEESIDKHALNLGKQHDGRTMEDGREIRPNATFSMTVPPNSPQSMKNTSSLRNISQEFQHLHMQPIPSTMAMPNANINEHTTEVIRSIINPIYEEIRGKHMIEFKEVNPDLCKDLLSIPVEQRVIYILQEPLDSLHDRQRNLVQDYAKQKASMIAAKEAAAAAEAAKLLEETALEIARKELAAVKRPRRPLTFQEKVMISAFCVISGLLIIGKYHHHHHDHTTQFNLILFH